MQVLIIGGGKHGGSIAERLLRRDEFRMIFRSSQYRITFVEEDEAKCQELEQRYNGPIFQGDPTKQEVLKQIQPENFDVAIAASEDDDRNAIAALQVKRLGVDRVIAIVREPSYFALLEDAGVECISQPHATAAMVENYLDRPGVVELFEIESGVASLMELVVPEQGPVVGRRIADIDIPVECVVAAVIRHTKFVVPVATRRSWPPIGWCSWDPGLRCARPTGRLQGWRPALRCTWPRPEPGRGRGGSPRSPPPPATGTAR